MPGELQGKFWFTEVQRKRFGVEYSRVSARDGSPYLDRYIVYLGNLTLRLHKFWQGDDARAPHDHPFHFITIPFTSYVETVEYESKYKPGRWLRKTVIVPAWRPSFRPAPYRHIVRGALGPTTSVLGIPTVTKKPFWTFCIAWFIGRPWGFWPDPKTFVPWREWS